MYSVVLSACTCLVFSAVDPLKEWTKVKWLGRGSFEEVSLYKNVYIAEEWAVKMVLLTPTIRRYLRSAKKTCQTVILRLSWITKLVFKVHCRYPKLSANDFFPLSVQVAMV